MELRRRLSIGVELHGFLLLGVELPRPLLLGVERVEVLTSGFIPAPFFFLLPLEEGFPSPPAAKDSPHITQ